MASIIFVPIAFASATLYLYLLANWGIYLFSKSETEQQIFFPSNLQDLQVLSVSLTAFYDQNNAYVLLLFASAYIYKQAFAIPGSVFMNLLAGAIFGLWPGFLLASILTASGASLCYLMTKSFAQQHISKYFTKKLIYLQTKVEENHDRLPYFLLFLRLFPMSPNWFLNMASPIVGISLKLFFVSVFIGLMPYNFICIQTGVILSKLKTLDDVFTIGILLKLALVAAVALIPTIFVKTKKLKKL